MPSKPVVVSSGSRWATRGAAGWAAYAGESDAGRNWREQLDAMAELGPVVYAVHTTDRLIKIGHTVSLKNRLRAYRIGKTNMHRLLMVKPGSREDERRIQRLFGNRLVRGREYFEPAAEIIYFINQVRAGLGAPPIDLL